MPKNTSKTTLPEFEQALKTLEDIVNKLETGDLSLEASLQSFEQGISLTRQCHQALNEAEQRVQILTNKNGSTERVDFADNPTQPSD